ncbi:MFS transporter [Microbispora catharanthi]|uniref:MFS transporter n=1 Tax=Microbispora catharanthi TaxID=1712871 RepID=A0A5N6BT59_9ACTN|nr:MFS transporter [Microbispora catharanthi]KAB8183540.1 MFS transporter [Microbispora catharanthi]
MIARLVAGRTVAALATALIPTGLTLAVIRVTGSALDLGVVLAAEMLPMLLLLPVGGVIADRFPPRRVILVADLVRCAAQVTLGSLLLLGRPGIAVMAGLAALTGAAVAFGVPAVSPLVIGVVPAQRRLRVNAHIGVAGGLAQIAGPALAGGMTLWLGPGWSFLLTGALFAGSAVTLGGLVTAPRPATERDHFLGDLREGWREARRHRWFLVSVAGHGVWHLGAGVLLTLGPVIAVRSLGGEPVWVIVAQAGTAAAVLGVFVAPRLPIRRPLAVAAVGAAVYACPLVAFAFPTAFAAPAVVVTAAYVVAMLGVGMLTPLWETVVQQRVEPQALGRVDSFDALISYAARPLGLAAAAPIAAWAGAALPLLTAAALVAAVNLAVLALPEVRRRTTEEAGQSPVPA